MTQPSPTPTPTPNHSREIRLGATVEGADHARFGHVAGTYRNYLIVERGFFLPIDYYVPMGAVRNVDGAIVTLGVSRDVALTQGWEHPPFTSGTVRPPASRSVPTAAPSRSAAVATNGRQTVRGTTAATDATSGAVKVHGQEAAAPASTDDATAPPDDTSEQPEAGAAPLAAPRFAPRLAREPVPTSGPFADTYAVGTNTDSYEALDVPSTPEHTQPQGDKAQGQPDHGDQADNRPPER